MNRFQRRAAMKNRKPEKKIFKEPEAEEVDFSGVPLATMCQSIQLLINELYSRGVKVYDFDNKDKYVQQVQIIQGKVFFLAAKEVEADGEV